MVDAINLLFAEDLLQLLVKLLGGSQIVPERLLDDHARPASVFFLRNATQAQHFDNRRKETGGNREIKKTISLRVVFLVRLTDLLFEPLIGFRILKIAFDVVDPLAHPFQELWVNRRGRVFGNLFYERFSEAFCSEVIHRKTDNRKLLRKKLFLSQIAERRDELALGKIARGSTNGHYARRSH